MKVIHITSMHEFDDDRIFQRACTGLVDEGINVGLITQYKGKYPVLIDDVNIYPLKVRKGIKRRIFSSFQAMRIAFKNKADIYHFHDPDLIPFMLILSLFGKHVVYDIHELYRVRFSQWKFIPNRLNGFLADVYQKFEHLCIKGMAGYTLPSKSMQKLWYKNLEKPHAVVRNIHLLSKISKFELKKNMNNSNFIIYTSGVNSPDRRNINIMKAFSKLYKKYDNIKLQFGGMYRPDGYEDKLKELAKELGIVDRFEMQGFLNYEEQFKRSSQVSLGLVLLEPNEKNYIATSNRMYEYMFCKIPIICEALPEPISVIDKVNCGYYLNSDNIDELANKIEQIYLNPEEAKKLGENGYNAVVSEFHYEKDLTSLINLYKRIIE
ncbi:glycosyltransferase [Aureibaculum luteum]|uniref:glycosyltransferase n=1 Tax=Aureibaculum luteum TaxID=1548456 RepID=UPI000E4A3C5E|nr:glycosyltransferase [Aureibaculum luteum]